MADSNEFEGFANAPVKRGKPVDFRKVPAYDDDTAEGRIRKESQTTESSIVAFKTEGVGTNGAPAAVVPAPKKDEPQDAAVAEGKGD